MNDALLKVEKLSKKFDRLPVLKDLTFSLAGGEILGLVGRQGAGKSTLFHVLNGAMVPSTGMVYFDGMPRRFKNRLQAQKLGIETVYPASNPIDQFDLSSNFFLDNLFGIKITRRTLGLVEQFDVVQNILLGREIQKLSGLGIID